jgi:hypothetical protein
MNNRLDRTMNISSLVELMMMMTGVLSKEQSVMAVEFLTAYHAATMKSKSTCDDSLARIMQSAMSLDAAIVERMMKYSNVTCDNDM